MMMDRKIKFIAENVPNREFSPLTCRKKEREKVSDKNGNCDNDKKDVYSNS
jgi:hypothetical protein